MRTRRSLPFVILIALAGPATALAFIPLPNPIPEEAPAPTPHAAGYEAAIVPAAGRTPGPEPTFPVGMAFVFGQVAEDLAVSNVSVGGSRIDVHSGHFDTSSYLGRIDAYVLGCTLQGHRGCDDPDRPSIIATCWALPESEVSTSPSKVRSEIAPAST